MKGLLNTIIKMQEIIKVLSDIIWGDRMCQWIYIVFYLPLYSGTLIVIIVWEPIILMVCWIILVYSESRVIGIEYQPFFRHPFGLGAGDGPS